MVCRAALAAVGQRVPGYLAALSADLLLGLGNVSADTAVRFEKLAADSVLVQAVSGSQTCHTCAEGCHCMRCHTLTLNSTARRMSYPAKTKLIILG